MKTSRIAVVLLAGLACVSASPPAPQSIDWPAVDKAMGRPSVAQDAGVHRFNFPRGDMNVVVDGVTIRPALALGGWIAMKPEGKGVIAMGDLVLAGDELTPVITRLLAGGFDQTAIHHHLIRESPRVLYMHVMAHGDPVAIANTLREALALTRVPAPASPPAAPASGDPGIDTAAVAKALGYSGRLNGGVYQVSVPRVETIRDGGMEIPAVMGLGTAINFQPTGGGKAAITGDYVMVASEVPAVTRALRDAGIEVTSLHNHLLNDEPRLFFMHFWANDDAVKLAGGLKAALAKTNSVRGKP
jgi:hypothetical protein